MPTNGEIRTAFNATTGSSQDDTHSSNTRRGPGRLALHSGVRPTRLTHPSANVSVNSDLTAKYNLVVKGFKLLENTCKDLTHKLADSEKMVRSREEAYAALEEKARSDEASYREQVSKMDNQIRTYEASFADLISQAQERIRTDAASYTAEVLRMEERLQNGELAYSKLAERMEECEKSLGGRESDLDSLRETIQQAVTCGVCQTIPTQPCSTDCRHIFCAMCLLSWWQTKQENSCPTCRTIAKSPPVRDPVQGFVALARAHAGEAEQSDSFDEDIFDAFFPAKAPNSSGSRRAPIEIS